MQIEKSIHALSELGRVMQKAGELTGQEEAGPPSSPLVAKLDSLVHQCRNSNPWFIPEFTRFAMKAWGAALQAEKVEKWLREYQGGTLNEKSPKKVAIIMAGNLPMVGFHDLLCVLASGNHAVVKLSSQDDILIPGLVEVITTLEPSWAGRVHILEQPLKGFDAVIATGSDNTSRYFDYYFGKYPGIIRRNRNGVAVITGEENAGWFRQLADDIFLYFGLGCRSVSKLYFPEGYDPAGVLEHFSEYRFVSGHHKYINNYDYHKSIMMVNRMEYYDNGFVLLRPDVSIASPVAVLNYEHYHSIEGLKKQLEMLSGQIQCLVAPEGRIDGAIPAGRTQLPELWDYADGVNTMEFLLHL